MATLTANELRAARKARLAAAKGLEATQYNDELDLILAEIDEDLSIDAELDELEAEIEAELAELEAELDVEIDAEEDVEIDAEEDIEALPMEAEGTELPETKAKGYTGLGHGKGAAYYPSTTKPTEMNPESSRNTGGLYHYYGPPPDFGGSYGSALTAMLLGSDNGSDFHTFWNEASSKISKRMAQVASALTSLDERIETTEDSAALEARAGKMSEAIHSLRSGLSGRTFTVESSDSATVYLGSCLDTLIGSIPEVAPPSEERVAAADGYELPENVTKLFAEISDLADDIIKSATWLDSERKAAANTQEDPDMSNVIAVLADTATLDGVTESEVHMALFNADSENPHWNVSIRGIPVAAIYLADQPNTPEVRAMFVDNAYANAITEGISRAPGLNDVLTAVNAKMFASVIDDADLATKIREEVKAELDGVYAQKVAETDENFLRCMSITLAGLQKNFFPSRNSLKEELFSEMKRAGVMDPSRAIETAFTNGGVDFFESAVSKARELMDMPPEAIVAIASAIGDSQVQLPAVVENHLDAGTEGYAAHSMGERMAQNTVPFQTYGDNDTSGQSFRERAERLLTNKGR